MRHLTTRIEDQHIYKLEQVGKFLDDQDSRNRSLALRTILDRLDVEKFIDNYKSDMAVFPDSKKLRQVYQTLLDHGDLLGEDQDRKIFGIDQDLLELRTSQCLGKKWESGKPQEVIDKLNILGYISGSVSDSDQFKVLLHYSEPGGMDLDDLGSDSMHGFHEFYNSKGTIRGWVKDLD